MKKLMLMLLLSILVFSCEQDDGVLVPTDEQNVEIRAKKNKVQICHKLGNGQFNLIEVNGNAEQAHINHGDGYPGECYDPEQNLYLTEVCELVEDGCFGCGDAPPCENINTIDFEREIRRVNCDFIEYNCDPLGNNCLYYVFIQVFFEEGETYVYSAEYGHTNVLVHSIYIVNNAFQFDDTWTEYDPNGVEAALNQANKMTEYIVRTLEDLGHSCNTGF